MAGSRPKFRHLSRDSAHRKALLRNLVTSLFEHESISTTWHKAKEAQRLAEKLVTLAKRNTTVSRTKAGAIFFRPLTLLPKLFGPIRERYTTRPGGYTRVLRIEPLKEDQAASAILELVDGPRDMRFALAAQTVARDRLLGQPHTALTKQNMEKVIAFRGEGGREQLEEEVSRFVEMERSGQRGTGDAEAKKPVYWKGLRGDQYYGRSRAGQGE